MSQINRNNKGFTLVEIVIVLAIAALVLAGILLAVRGAQQSRRDSARRDAAGQIMAVVEEYAGNHEGNYPTTVTPIDNAFDLRRPGNAANFSFGGFAATCPALTATDDVLVGITGRQAMVCYRLESGDVFRATNQ